MEIHIGEKIKNRAKELRIGPTELGQKISTSKQNVYGIYKRKSIDTELLRKLSVALEYDFFLYYVNVLSSLHDRNEIAELGGNGELNQLREKIMKLEAEFQTLKKENEYLKKINELLEDKQNNKNN